MPELEEFLRPFTVHFVQRPSAAVLERYVSGRLTECPHKNCDTIAQVVPGASEQWCDSLAYPYCSTPAPGTEGSGPAPYVHPAPARPVFGQ